MTLDEAIKHCEEKSCDNSPCAQEHKELAGWLQELKQYRLLYGTVSEELEDAATKSANKATPYTRVDIGNGEVCVYTKHVVIDRFKAGAKWQKKQIDKDVENLINVIRNSCAPNAFGTLEQCIAAAQIEALKLIKED